MSYKLEKPYTERQYADFVVKYNHNKGLKIEETQLALYALEIDEIMQDEEPIINPNYETEMAQHERERLNALTLTKRQFFLCLLDLFNITPSQVELVIEASASASAKIEFQYASGFLRGNPLFDELSPALGLTPAQVDEVFEAGQEY